jgi:hypothetical protein
MAVSISPLVSAPLYNGAVAGSAKIYVYQSGTSTPVITYSNAALSVANTNPIITDSNGEAIVYVATGQALRMLFTTSDGATIRDIDPIYIDPILTNLTASVADLNLTTTYLNGITPGTTTANKALVVDSNKRMDVLTVGTLSLGAGAGTAITSTATELNKLTGCTAVTSELNTLAGVTAGTVTASKALVVDSSSKLNILNVDNITVDANTISSTDTNGNINLTPNGTGKVKLSGLSYPTADGIANQVIKTDGAGNLSFGGSSSGFLLNQFYPSF